MSVPSPLDLSGFWRAVEAAGAAEARFPPPVFAEGGPDVRDYRPGHAGTRIGAVLVVRFPVHERYLDALGMQGGAIALAVDHTVGALGALVAPPSVPSHLEVTYRQPVAGGTPYVEVEARLAERAGRRLVFDAAARSSENVDLAVARLTRTVRGEG